MVYNRYVHLFKYKNVEFVEVIKLKNSLEGYPQATADSAITIGS